MSNMNPNFLNDRCNFFLIISPFLKKIYKESDKLSYGIMTNVTILINKRNIEKFGITNVLYPLNVTAPSFCEYSV